MASVIKVDTIKSLAGNEAITISESGVPLLNVPAFMVKLSSDFFVTSGVSTNVIFNSEVVDTNDWYDTSTGYFTPQIAGFYQLNATLTLRASSGLSRGQVRVYSDNNSSVAFQTDTAAGTTNYMAVSTSSLFYFNGSTDNIIIRAYVVGTSPYLESDQCILSGFLVRAA